jgi:hypothetical protein
MLLLQGVKSRISTLQSILHLDATGSPLRRVSNDQPEAYNDDDASNDKPSQDGLGFDYDIGFVEEEEEEEVSITDDNDANQAPANAMVVTGEDEFPLLFLRVMRICQHIKGRIRDKDKSASLVFRNFFEHSDMA